VLLFRDARLEAISAERVSSERKMAGPIIAFSSTQSQKLSSSPINPDWILEGQPMARNAILSRSADETACTIMWDCTAGKFRWYYDFDETIHIIDGSVSIDDGAGPRTIGPGDVVFFPAGSSAVWVVETYVRKLAFCRKALPAPIGAAVKMLRSMKAAMRGAQPDGASLMKSA
jgi:uncharacterized protein